MGEREPAVRDTEVRDSPGADGRVATNAGRRRRATTPPPPGSDPAPYDPPTQARPDSENDARLREDKPPHWG